MMHGGGGGIALLSGMSGILSWPKFVLTVALATVFVPPLTWLGIVNAAALVRL